MIIIIYGDKIYKIGKMFDDGSVLNLRVTSNPIILSTMGFNDECIVELDTGVVLNSDLIQEFIESDFKESELDLFFKKVNILRLQR